MSTADLAATLVKTGLSKAQQLQIMLDRGISREEAEAALATAAHTASTTTATGATLGLTGATNSLIVALKGLWTSMMSNPITAIITLALTLIATITRVVFSIKQGAEEAAQAAREASQEIKDSFSSAMTTISDNLTTLNSLKEEFAKLSKGVDTYGNNISLTADEYERYKEIVKTIVGISPELVAGYDNEGNALANKNGLLEKSIKLMEEEQRLKKEEMVTDENLWTVAKGNIQDIKDSWDAIGDMQIPNDLAFSGVKIVDGKKEYGYVNQIPDYVEQAIGIEFDEWNDGGSLNYIAKNIDEVYAHLDEILNNARTGFTDENGNVWAGLEETQIASLKNLIINIKSYTDDIEEASNEFNEYLQLIPQSMTQYSELDDPSKDFLSQWIRTFDIDEDTSESEIKGISEKIHNFTKKIADNEDIELVIGAAVKLDTDKNSEKMTVAEYQAAVDNFMTQLGTLDEDAQAYIKVAFGIDGDKNEWDKAVNDKISRVKNILKNEDDDKVYGLSMGDLEIAYNIQADTDSLTFEELKEKIEQYKADLGTISFDSYFEDAKSLISEIDSVRSIIESQSIGVSISVEDYNSEELADYTSALEYNNGVLQLNAEKVREIANAKAEETIATNDANKAMAQTEYLRNAAEIERLRKKIADKNYATNESEESVQKNIDALLLENDTLQKECNTYDLITSSLREATNAYNNWLNAQNASQRGEMFDDTLNAINRVNETLNDSDSDYFGRVGRTDYKAAVELIVPDSIDPEDSEKVNAYLKSVYDLFTYDDDGNYSGLNIANFCQKAVDAGLMVLDESGENYQIAGSKTMEDFAEGLNLSLPLVQAMFGEMEEFGGEFSWADEANKTIGDLAVSANVAAENLRGLHSDMTITLDVSDLTTAKEKSDALDSTIKQMQDLKATVGVDAEEVEYANSIISYCITQKQQLSEPAILDVDVSKVSETTDEAVLLIQNFQKACNDLELKKALGLDTTDAQAKVDELYSQITSSDNDALLALKLDTTSVETVKSSIAGLTIQRVFTFNDQYIYNALGEIAKEVNCIFDIECKLENGKIKRGVKAYDSDLFGKSTPILISPYNLAEDITYKKEVDSVANCYRLESGDDLMNATIVNCNPNGTAYIWNFTNDDYEDMSESLKNGIEKYNELYTGYISGNLPTESGTKSYTLFSEIVDEYRNNLVVASIIVMGIAAAQKVANETIDKYKGNSLISTPPDIAKYSESENSNYNKIISRLYEAIEYGIYLEHNLMPKTQPDESTAKDEADKIESQLTEVAVADITKASKWSVADAVVKMAKVIIDNTRYSVQTGGKSTYANNQWSGSLIVKKKTGKAGENEATIDLVVSVSEDVEKFVKQQIDIELAKAQDQTGIVALFKKSANDFKAELKKYCLTSLKAFQDCAFGCMDIIDQKSDDTWYDKTKDIRSSLNTKLDILSDETEIREKEHTAFSCLSEMLLREIQLIHEKLSFEKSLGSELWNELSSYRKESSYSNSNYISDGLSDAELLSNASEFYNAAKNEISRLTESSHTITSNIYNLLAMKEFAPIVDYFELGNWIKCNSDGNLFNLRLSEYEIDYDNLESLNVTFSDTKTFSNEMDIFRSSMLGTSLKKYLKRVSNVIGSISNIFSIFK